jgi:hypothetical protein
MTDFRVIVTSDWHLDKLTLGVSRFEDIVAAANEVVDYAIQSNRHDSRSVFVFAGDLCNPDTPRCWRAVREATRMRARLVEGCVPSVWLTGNHDITEDGYGSHTLMALDDGHPLVHVVGRPMRLTLWGRLHLMCLPYVPASHGQYDPVKWLETEPPVDVALVVGHLMLEGIAVGSETKDMARGRDVFLPIDTIRRLYPNAKVVNGHYHEAQIYRGVYVPGALGRLTKGEVHNDPRFLEFHVGGVADGAQVTI